MEIYKGVRWLLLDTLRHNITTSTVAVAAWSQIQKSFMGKEGSRVTAVVTGLFSSAVYRASGLPWHEPTLRPKSLRFCSDFFFLFPDLSWHTYELDFALTAVMSDICCLLSTTHALCCFLENPMDCNRSLGGSTKSGALFKLPAGLCWTGTLILKQRTATVNKRKGAANLTARQLIDAVVTRNHAQVAPLCAQFLSYYSCLNI